MPLYDSLGYGNEKIAVIFDIGAAYTKCGFAGESSPRCITSSVVKRSKTDQIVRVHDVTNEEELFGVLVDFVHVLYFRHVLVNPKERRVVIVESVLATSVFRETLAKVLFKHFEVPSLLFAPSHLMAMFTLGTSTALVMDSGYSETLVLPIFEGIPIMRGCQGLPLAGKAIHGYLEAQLKETATVKGASGEAKTLSSAKESIDEKVIEDIKVKCCFVTKLVRAKQIQATYTGKEGAEMPSPPSDVDFPVDGKTVMSIPGKIREHTCEVLFERDREDKSVATLILDSISQCPIDIRKTMAENILVIGGTGMLPGFKHRLLSELHDLKATQLYSHLSALKTFKFHAAPAKENFTAWLGGAIFGALEILSSRSVNREQFNLNHQRLPDWCCLAEYEEKDERALLLQKETSKDKPLMGALKKEKANESAVTVVSKAT